MLAGGIPEAVDFLRGQIFPLTQIGVTRPAWRNCPIYDELTGREGCSDFSWQKPLSGRILSE
jgi:hypothetical protein